MNRTSKRILAIGMPLAAVAVTGVAFAAWTATGNGSGYAKAGTASAVTDSTVDMSATSSGLLYPGGTGDLQIKLTNPNPYPVKVTDIINKASSYISSDKGTACTDANSTHPTGVTFTNQTGLTTLTLAAHGDVSGNDVKTFTLNGVLSMTNASDNGCQGAVFTVPVTVTSVSDAS